MTNRTAFTHGVLSLALCAGLGGCDRKQASADSTAPSAPPSASAVPSSGLPALAPDARELILAKTVGGLLQAEHWLRKKPDDALSREAFDEYMARLDGRKLYLLKEHVDALSTMKEQLDDQLRSGSMELARVGEKMLIERRSVAETMVAEILAEPFDFTKDESVETDVEKVAWAADDGALRERWRKVLKLQVLERIVSMEEVAKARAERAAKPSDDGAGGGVVAPEPIPETFEAKEKKARGDVATSYDSLFKRLADRDPLTPASRFLSAVAAVYDPHTDYLPPREKENFDISISGSLEGIGALLGVKDHLVEVRELVPGGASWRQGELEAGDLILAVSSDAEQRPVDITDMSLDRVVDMIRGPKDSKVALRVQKTDGRIETITIVRDVIVIEASYARAAIIGEGDAAACYLRLPSFYGNTRDEPGATGKRASGSDVAAILDRCQAKNVSSAIVDLRGNGGGLLSQAVDIAGHFIEKGPVVQVRRPDGDKEVYSDDDPKVRFDGDVVVMVDRFSASASEILAGALQDYRRAVIVGTGPTHGKGSVQILVPLARVHGGGPDLGVLKLTTQQYFLVDGDSTQSRGVVPDVVLPDPAGHVETGERFLDHALPWSEVAPLTYQRWKKADWDPEKLVAASAKRTAEEPVFGAVEARRRFLEQRRAQTQLPLSAEKYRERRAKADAVLDELSEKLEGQEKERFPVAPLDYAGDAAEAAKDPRLEKRLEQWKDDLATDAWVDETLQILRDMRSAG